MAQIAKWIPLKQIIWEVYRDTSVQDQLPISDLYEWSIDCLSLIGNPNGMLHKVTGHIDNPNLDITNYRAKLPCDFYKIRQVAVNGYPALPSSGNFHQLMDGSCCGTDELGTTNSDGTFVDNFGNTFITNLGVRTLTTPLTYELNNDYITLSVKTGKVCISYLAHPVDECGLPMIPDEISYKEAVKKFIIMKIDYIRWRNNPDSQGLRALYEDSDREYCWYVGQAANKAKSLDSDGMEVLKNSLLRLAPTTEQWSSFFSQMGVPEARKMR